MIGSMIVFVIKKHEIILSQISLMKACFFCKPRNDGWVRAWSRYRKLFKVRNNFNTTFVRSTGCSVIHRIPSFIFEEAWEGAESWWMTRKKFRKEVSFIFDLIFHPKNTKIWLIRRWVVRSERSDCSKQERERNDQVHRNTSFANDQNSLVSKRE